MGLVGEKVEYIRASKDLVLLMGEFIRRIPMQKFSEVLEFWEKLQGGL